MLWCVNRLEVARWWLVTALGTNHRKFLAVADGQVITKVGVEGDVVPAL